MIYLLIFIVLIAIILIIGKVNLAIQFNKEVKQLFSQSKSFSNKKFSYEQLMGLPEPVQRYFKHVLKEGQPFINTVRLSHNGEFKPGLKKKWVNIEGEQYFTAGTPGFIWKGKTSMFIARDMYIAGKGRLVVSLFSLFNVVDGKGEEYNQGELLRWLAESIWFPTNLLSTENLQWVAINESSAKLIFNYKNLSIFFTITFNDKDEIIQMETKRYMDEKKLETWIIKSSGYKEFNGVLIPTTNEVMWRLEEGDFSYAKFKIKKIEYNIPERF